MNHHIRVVPSLITLLAAIAGCGPSEEKQPDLAAVRACSTGTWTRAEHACTCPVGIGLDSVECGQADCREANALVLGEDGASYDFAYRYSRTGGTLSVIGGAGGVSQGKWTITPDLKLVQDFGTPKTYQTPLTCGGNSLVRTTAAYTRVEPSRSTSLARSMSSRWARVALSP